MHNLILDLFQISVLIDFFFQEKYMSEAYSETQDVETARRLLDFGDDYRNFLDSQSDYASSLSAVYYVRSHFI